MSFYYNIKSSIAERLWYTMALILSYTCCESVMQATNKQNNIWHNKKGGIAGFLLYAIIVIVLIVILILVLRFLFNII